ncbi:hypothetical protein SALBM217S_08072 [Streptomyces griseoloalbus]
MSASWASRRRYGVYNSYRRPKGSAHPATGEDKPVHELADSVESMEQLASVWRTLLLDRDPEADVRDLPGIAVRWADSRFAFWNCVTLTGVGTDAELLERQLKEAAQIMRGRAARASCGSSRTSSTTRRAPRWTRPPSRQASRTPSPAPAWRATCCPSPHRTTPT